MSRKQTATFSPTDRVDHYVYGAGTIVAVDSRLTTIAFDEAGTKKFMTSMVELTASEVPAPAKPVRKKKKKTRSSK